MSIKEIDNETGEVTEKWKDLVIMFGRQEDIQLGPDMYGWREWALVWNPKSFRMRRVLGPSWPYQMSGGPDTTWEVAEDIGGRDLEAAIRYRLRKARERTYRAIEEKCRKTLQRLSHRHNALEIDGRYRVEAGPNKGQGGTCFWIGVDGLGLSPSMVRRDGKYPDAIWGRIGATKIARVDIDPIPVVEDVLEIEELLQASPQKAIETKIAHHLKAPFYAALTELSITNRGLYNKSLKELCRDSMSGKPQLNFADYREHPLFLEFATIASWTFEDRFLEMFFDGNLPGVDRST